MADLSFLTEDPYEHRDSLVSVLLPDQSVNRLAHVSYNFIADKCPLLSFAFEDPPTGTRSACIEATSKDVVVRLLRFLYTGDYLTPVEQVEFQLSLLVHVEVYKIAMDYDLPVLQLAANGAVTRGTEMACSMPALPTGFCDAVRFVYKHLKSEQSLVDTLCNYCVSIFKYQSLRTDTSFHQLVIDVPEFHQSICKTNSDRDFLDEGAVDIISLSASRPYDRSIALFDMDQRTHAEFHFDERFDPSLRDIVDTTHSAKRRKTYPGGTFSIVHRPKDPKLIDVFSENEQSDQDDGFTLVHRPKVNTPPADNWDPKSPSDTPGNSDIYDDMVHIPALGSPGSSSDTDGSFSLLFAPLTSSAEDEAAIEVPANSDTTPVQVQTPSENFGGDEENETTDSEWTRVPSPTPSEFEFLLEM